jgi:hypothetical protein
MPSGERNWAILPFPVGYKLPCNNENFSKYVNDNVNVNENVNVSVRVKVSVIVIVPVDVNVIILFDDP